MSPCAGDIHSQIGMLLAEGYPVRSECAGRTGKVLAVEGPVVIIRGKRKREVTTFRYGDPVEIRLASDGFGWSIVDLPKAQLDLGYSEDSVESDR